MDFLELLQQRHSIRKYKEQRVEEEKLYKILEAGRIAPTSCNVQPQKIYVYQSEEDLLKLRQLTKMVYNAPVVIHICYDSSISWNASHFGEPEVDTGEMDATIVASLMMMEATSLGLGTLWVRGYHSKEVEAAFELPPNIKSVCMLLVGYADENKPYRKTTRKELSETTYIR